MRTGLTIALLIAVIHASALADGDGALLGFHYNLGGNGELFEIDPVSGAGVRLGSTGLDRMVGLTMSPTGQLLAARTSNLCQLDPATGAVLGSRDTLLQHIGGLAFSAEGVLYACGLNGHTPDRAGVWTVDLTNGKITPVTPMGPPMLTDIAFSPDGVLYGWDVAAGGGVGRGLVTINTLTGQIADVNPAVDGTTEDVQALEFSWDGRLYGGRHSLAEIDTLTGELTTIGPIGADLRGLTFIPEPGALGLLAVAALRLLRRRRLARRSPGT